MISSFARSATARNTDAGLSLPSSMARQCRSSWLCSQPLPNAHRPRDSVPPSTGFALPRGAMTPADEPLQAHRPRSPARSRVVDVRARQSAAGRRDHRHPGGRSIDPSQIDSSTAEHLGRVHSRRRREPRGSQHLEEARAPHRLNEQTAGTRLSALRLLRRAAAISGVERSDGLYQCRPCCSSSAPLSRGWHPREKLRDDPRRFLRLLPEEHVPHAWYRPQLGALNSPRTWSPFAGGISRSASPWMTSVGAAIASSALGDVVPGDRHHLLHDRVHRRRVRQEPRDHPLEEIVALS